MRDTDDIHAGALDRRGLLGAGTSLALSASLLTAGVGCGDDDGDTSTTGNNSGSGEELSQDQSPEVRGLIRIRGLERRAIATYGDAVRFSRGGQVRLLREITEQCREHVAALTELLAQAGGPVSEPESGEDATILGLPAFIRDDVTALRASRNIARRLVRAYVVLLPLSPDPSRRRELMSILGNDAQHVELLGGGYLISSPAFDQAGSDG